MDYEALKTMLKEAKAMDIAAALLEIGDTDKLEYIIEELQSNIYIDGDHE